MNVVVVESPAKAKTINKYLGSGYQVFASYGHVRDLPAKDGSVAPDDDFAMKWTVDPKANKRLNEIADAAKDSDTVILATDPDREGEAISWHVLEVLRKKGALKSAGIQRVVFNAITKQAVLEAMDHPRDIDSSLVDAYLARRALDYLVGFTLSPVLWRKLPGARSAGRVQSVALRLVCDREAEIEAFRSQEYWSIVAKLGAKGGEDFDARLTAVAGNKLDKLDISNGDDAEAIRADLDSASFRVTGVESKPQKRNPYPPFTTSTLQQEASRKLGFSSARTMQTAQKLYEGVSIDGETQGLITYMRTDGVQIAPEAITETRSVIEERFGNRYVPSSPREYKTKAKNAQEAHEAIRPTELTRHPQDVAKLLDPDMAKLYELVWKRTVASQMQSAEVERTSVDIEARGAKNYSLRASGSVIRFDGFLALYQEGRDDSEGEDDPNRLPPLESGDTPEKRAIEANQHFTEPPPRYTEASLIKRMEELGIGRPSTYTATLQTLRDREYVTIDKKRLIPDDKGRLVTAFLGSFFERYIEYDFTAALEEKLDRISAGEVDWKTVLREFWDGFSAHVDGTSELRVAQVIDSLNEVLGDHLFPKTDDDADPRKCPSCDDGQLSLKIGKFGSFIGCSNYPECRYTRQIGESKDDAPAIGDDGIQQLGEDPETGLAVTARSGRFGPFVQLGEQEGKEKPKRASIPKEFDPAKIDLEGALKLLRLPREIGQHPESGETIVAGIGRYGPFVNLGKTYANLDSIEEVFTVGLNRAVTLIAEKQQKGGGRGRTAPALKELGKHDEFGDIVVRDGRYGPYVTNGKINATLPKGTDPQAVDMAKALELIEAKAASGGKKKPKRKKRAAAS